MSFAYIANVIEGPSATGALYAPLVRMAPLWQSDPLQERCWTLVVSLRYSFSGISTLGVGSFFSQKRMSHFEKLRRTF
jgi:hypothetical protein